MVRVLGLVACLTAAFLLFYQAARTPAPLPASASGGVFSAGRAIEDIKVIAAVPHPIGSPANAKVRDYVVARMTALGLSPRIQRASTAYPVPRAPSIIVGGVVENIIGVLPGRNRALPALAIMAHYDSVPGSPGAADDAAGVASALEIIRAIKLKGTPARDVMLLITDGEEAGLLGAHAFFTADPAAAHVGYVLNMEARGGGGRASMFQTGSGNGPSIALFQRTATAPESNSLLAFIYKMLPNDTDLTVSLGKGLPGLNYAFIGRQFDYHSPTSTLANLDRGSVQHMGSEVLGTAMAMAFADSLPARGEDVVYGGLPFGLNVAYPPAAGWALLLIAAAATAYGAFAARRAKAFSWRDLWKGVGASVLLLIATVLVLTITRLATGVAFGFVEQRPLLARFPLFELAMFASGLAVVLLIPPAMAAGKGRRAGVAIMLGAGLVLAALGGFDLKPLAPPLVMALVGAVLAFLLFGRAACVAGVWTGLLVTGLGAALALQIAAPTAALIIAWPVTAAAVASALLAAGSRKGAIAWVAGAVLITLTLSWIGADLHGFMVGLDQPALPAVIIWIGALALLPLAWPRSSVRWLTYVPGVLALVAGMGIAIGLRLSDPWSARYPDASTVQFVVDQETGKAWLGSSETPGDWSRRVLTAGGATVRKKAFGIGRPWFVTEAPAVHREGPAVSVTRGPDGEVTITVPYAPGMLTLGLTVTTNTLVNDVRVNGDAVRPTAAPGKPLSLYWQAAPEGLTLSFRPAGPGSLTVAYGATYEGWPAEARPLPPTPATVSPFGQSGTTMVVGKTRATL